MRVLLILLIISCGIQEHNQRKAVGPSEWERRFLELQGTIDDINNFVSNDFADCTTGLSSFSEKICSIAQAATLEQRIIFSSQLSEMVKMFQDELYGEDCTNVSEVGCPAVGSITNTLSTLESRLDNFDGSGDSIETVLTDIDDRLTTIEEVISSDSFPIMISICEDISNSGPIYETGFLSGDRTKFNAWVKAGGDEGLGLIKEYGDGDGDVYLQTELNTRKCKFKIYEISLDSTLKLCWNNSNRNASESSIDTECDYSGSFASPTANCTCK